MEEKTLVIKQNSLATARVVAPAVMSIGEVQILFPPLAA